MLTSDTNSLGQQKLPGDWTAVGFFFLQGSNNIEIYCLFIAHCITIRISGAYKIQKKKCHTQVVQCEL